MSKLFLASSLQNTFNDFIIKSKLSPQLHQIAIVLNASDPYTENSSHTDLNWVRIDIESFEKNGFKVALVDLTSHSSLTENQKAEFLGQFAGIHFCGGNASYLIRLIHHTGFYEPIRKSIYTQKLIMSGSSAGAMIAGPSLKGLEFLDDSFEYDNNNILNDTKGLWLTDFLIIPHFDTPDNIESHKKLMEKTDYPYPLILLSDSQAVWCDSGLMEMIV